MPTMRAMTLGDCIRLNTKSAPVVNFGLSALYFLKLDFFRGCDNYQLIRRHVWYSRRIHPQFNYFIHFERFVGLGHRYALPPEHPILFTGLQYVPYTAPVFYQQQ